MRRASSTTSSECTSGMLNLRMMIWCRRPARRRSRAPRPPVPTGPRVAVGQRVISHEHHLARFRRRGLSSRVSGYRSAPGGRRARRSQARSRRLRSARRLSRCRAPESGRCDPRTPSASHARPGRRRGRRASPRADSPRQCRYPSARRCPTCSGTTKPNPPGFVDRRPTTRSILSRTPKRLPRTCTSSPAVTSAFSCRLNATRSSRGIRRIWASSRAVAGW